MATDSDIEKEGCERFEDAKQHKAKFRSEFEEAYYFTAPTRKRQMESASTASEARPGDKFELSTSIGIEANEDFSTMLISTFFPKSEQWAKSQVSAALPAMEEAEINDLSNQIERDDDTIFDAINASNLRAELSKTFTPDAGIGTVALHIDPGPLNSIRVLGAPLTEIYGNVGPDGSVDDRWWERATTARRLYGLVPSLKNAKGEKAEKWRDKITKTPGEACSVKWGWWRDWGKDEETWTWVVLIGADLIDTGSVTGEGSCSFLIGRFGASPEWAFGNGPTLKSLPELRSIDELSSLLIENIDMAVSPAMTWPSETFMNVENGIESRKFYAVEPDGAKDVKPLFEVKGLDQGYFQLDEFERRVKRLHYVDKPEQRADTPPTATQWMSEMELGQRRFGVPGEVFWHEVPRAIYLRFRHILKQRGAIKPLQAKGQNVIISAVNPATRAADMQEVANASRFCEIGGQAFPEEFKVAVDGAATLENLRAKLGVKNVVAMRPQEQFQQAADLIAPLVKGAVPGVEPGPGVLNPGEAPV